MNNKYEKIDSVRFNFVLDEQLFNDLTNFSRKCKKSISFLIRMILQQCYFMIEKADFTINDMSKQAFNEGDINMTHNLRVTISSKQKRQLFLIQDHFLLRSKAEVLRHILRTYFKKVKKYAKSNFNRVRERFERMWMLMKCRMSEWNKKDIVHMDSSAHIFMSCHYDPAINLIKITS